jgi:hypothetical protein
MQRGWLCRRGVCHLEVSCRGEDHTILNDVINDKRTKCTSGRGAEVLVAVRLNQMDLHEWMSQVTP